MKRSILVLIALSNLVLVPAQAAPLSTAFTYQGRLADNGQFANGTYDFQFRLFDAPTNGAQVQVVLGYPTVAVSNGLFTTGLDFGSNVFNGTTWWLEISLRRAGTFGEFVFLSPRQPLTPSPNALFSINAALAMSATTANGVAASVISPAQLNTPGAPANGQVLSYSGTSLVWTNASTIAASWKLNGNSDTTTGVNFLGTTDNQALELRVNGRRALRIEPNTNGAPNFIGGASVNQVDDGVIGATIVGGGASDYDPGVAYPNRISSNFGVIGGGGGNTIQPATFGATIAGGTLNMIQSIAYRSTIGGGAFNSIQTNAYHSTIGGGYQNSIQTNANGSTIGGGNFNTIQTNADRTTIGGGSANVIQADAASSTISGGNGNVIQSRAASSFIGGGSGNTIGTNAIGAVIPGGIRNTANGLGSFAAGSGANASHDGAFVWSDFIQTVPPNFASSATNEFAVRATGGVRFVSAVDRSGTPQAGVSLPAGSGAWLSLSDRDAKTNFALVNPRNVLERLAQMPIQTWNYKTQTDSTRHMGPVAQDFYSAFGVGEDNRHIATVDADGVALAAIQGLNQKLEAELYHRDAELRALRQQLTELKTALGKQTTPTKGGRQ